MKSEGRVVYRLPQLVRPRLHQQARFRLTRPLDVLTPFTDLPQPFGEAQPLQQRPQLLLQPQVEPLPQLLQLEEGNGPFVHV